MIEIERTFLAKFIPDLTNCKKLEIIDYYIPTHVGHPTIRIRKIGDNFEITKNVNVKKATLYVTIKSINAIGCRFLNI